jgi:hypothetical protein
MRKKIFILLLFFISTGYLFPQTEENEIIKVDMVIIEELASANEKKDLINQDFYNDYLSTLPNSEKPDSIVNPLAFKKGGSIYIATLSGGVVFPSANPVGSLTLRASTTGVSHSGLHGIHGVIKAYGSLNEESLGYLLMLGYTYTSGRNILDISAGFFLGRGELSNRSVPLTGVTYYYRFSKYTTFSLNMDMLLVLPVSLTAGIGICL